MVVGLVTKLRKTMPPRILAGEISMYYSDLIIQRHIDANREVEFRYAFFSFSTVRKDVYLIPPYFTLTLDQKNRRPSSAYS